MYIAEASPTAQRGRLVGLQSVFITLGRFSGALASAVAFSVLPPMSTGRRKASIIHSTTTGKAGRGLFQLQWLDILDFSSRRFPFASLSCLSDVYRHDVVHF